MKNKRIRNATVVFFISTAMFVAVMFCCDIYPFGDNSFITGDLNSIYIPEYMYVKDIISDTVIILIYYLCLPNESIIINGSKVAFARF